MSIKPHLPILIISGVIAIWYVLDLINDRTTYQHLLEKGVESTGVVQDVDYRNVFIHYSAGDSSYTSRRVKPFIDIEKHEVYRIYYDRSNPEEFVVDYSQPTYCKKYYTITRTLEIRLLMVGDVEFKYSVNNEVYKRTQRIAEEVSISDSLEYRVYVNKDNPEIAYIDPTTLSLDSE